MRNYNKLVLTGNLVEDPKVFKTTQGQGCRFRLASNYGREKTVFINCVIFDSANYAHATTFAKHKIKGDPVLVEGQLENDDWTDDAGVTHRGMTVLVRESLYLSKAPEGAGATKADTPF